MSVEVDLEEHRRRLAREVKLMELAMEVFKEVKRQDERWGEQNHEDGTGPDETMPDHRMYDGCLYDVRTALNEGKETWALILLEEVFEVLVEDDPKSIREELVQVAAVAQNWISAIDRRSE